MGVPPVMGRTDIESPSDLDRVPWGRLLWGSVAVLALMVLISWSRSLV